MADFKTHNSDENLHFNGDTKPGSKEGRNEKNATEKKS